MNTHMTNAGESSAALACLERALSHAIAEEAMYASLPDYRAEHLLAARLVTLLEADLAEVARLLAKHSDERLRASLAQAVIEANCVRPMLNDNNQQNGAA